MEARDRHQRPIPSRGRHWPRAVRAQQGRRAAQPQDWLRHHSRVRNHGGARPGDRHGRPPRAPRPHDRRLRHERRAAHCGRLWDHRRADGAARRRADAHHDADARGHAGARALRAVRQHCARQLFGHRRPARAQAGGLQGLRAHRGRLRLRYGRREVLQHQVLLLGPHAQLRHHRQHGSLDQASRRRSQGGRRREAGQGVHRGEPRPRSQGLGQPRRAHQQCARAWRAARGGDQPLQRRHRL
mmetsp:Transcript_33345/g.91253  ORF Transcript_33345/g.91253 Transcript_33345/m.91253 type:complete len:242 (-) Transcript_33345:1078-1803(-)